MENSSLVPELHQDFSRSDWECFWKHLWKFQQDHPNPRLWAIATGNTIPDVAIYGRESHLQRPECVCYSPSGRLMAVVNTGNWELVLYRTNMDGSPQACSIPCATISDIDHFAFLHDAEFFASDTSILVVAAESNAISRVTISESSTGSIMLSSDLCVHGEMSQLDYPTSLSLCPQKDFLAVANRRRTGIAIFSVDKQRFMVGTTPIQVISEDFMLSQGLASPHCLAFSPDSRFLFVTHKEFWGGSASNGKCVVAVFRCTDNNTLPIIPKPILVLPYDYAPTLHSIAIHPNGRIVAVANSIEYPGGSQAADIDVLAWNPNSYTLNKVHSLSVFRLWEGAKGVAFSPDGTHLSISTELNEILIYRLPSGIL